MRSATATEAVARQWPQRPAHGHTASARPGHTATQVPIGALAGAWMAGMTMPARQHSRAPQLGVDTSPPHVAVFVRGHGSSGPVAYLRPAHRHLSSNGQAQHSQLAKSWITLPAGQWPIGPSTYQKGNCLRPLPRSPASGHRSGRRHLQPVPPAGLQSQR